MELSDEFILIEHLQVLDEPLSSLYVNPKNGKYFLSVRLYEDTNKKSYILSEVRKNDVLKYMKRLIGLKALFESNTSFYYQADNKHVLCYNNLVPLTKKESSTLLSKNSSLDDMHDMYLAYRSNVIKTHLR